METLRVVCNIICSAYFLLNSICFFYAAIWYHKGPYPRGLRNYEGVLGIMFLSLIVIMWVL